ncbi:gluconokinase [Phormidium tenue FACHB-886]|nr:gluconokinase [Phormidium tenue FACHB-886]
MVFIGIDIGTTSTKTIAFTSAGEMQAIATHGYPLSAPQPGYSEQDPEVIFAAVIAGLQDLLKQNIAPDQVEAIGFSGAMHSLIAMDTEDRPLTNSITWADNRSVEQVERLKQGSGFAIYQRTGTPIHPMSPLPKLMWMREQDPERFQRASKFISIKEYVLFRLFGRYVVDYSIASATGLLNLRLLRWDEEALAIAGIRAEQLSELVPTTYKLRGMRREYAEAAGLDADTPVIVGSSDGALANLGVGAIGSDQLAVTVGTSGAVRQVVSQPLTDPQGRTFCYALTEKHWLIGGASNSGGLVLRWFRDRFGQAEIEQAKQQNVDPYEILIQVAESVPAGADGLVFLPFLTGERAPNWNSDARGVFFGVALHHDRAHFVRAVLEGILYSVYSITAVLSELAEGEKVVRASGGFARSKPWLQMMADVFGYKVLIPEVYEASGFGAAALAMYAVGALNDLSEVQSLIQIRDYHLPNLELSERYQTLFGLYQQVYSQLVNEFTTIAAYQRGRE